MGLHVQMWPRDLTVKKWPLLHRRSVFFCHRYLFYTWVQSQDPKPLPQWKDKYLQMFQLLKKYIITNIYTVIHYMTSSYPVMTIQHPMWLICSEDCLVRHTIASHWPRSCPNLKIWFWLDGTWSLHFSVYKLTAWCHILSFTLVIHLPHLVTPQNDRNSLMSVG